MDDYQLSPNGNETQIILQKLRAIGFLRMDEGWYAYLRYLTRIIYNPSSALLPVIRQERARIGSPDNQIGVHIRCGGQLSDINEYTAFVTRDIMASIPGVVRSAINGSAIPRDKLFIFLSTDSSLVVDMLERELQPIPIKTTAVYTRGHSTIGLVSDDTLKRSFVDMFLVADSKELLLTSSSAFSRIVQWMSGNKHASAIIAPHSNSQGRWGRKRNDSVSL